MGRFAKECVDVFCELTGYDKGKVGTAPTPFIDESKDPLAVTQTAPEAAAKAAPAGELSHIATKCLMTIMYIARFARPDLLRAVGALTTMVTRWDELCDRKLFRIVRYINGTVDWRHIGFVGDTTENIEIGLFSDADFGGDRADMKSTSGVFLALYGPHTFYPLAAQSKKANSGVS